MIGFLHIQGRMIHSRGRLPRVCFCHASHRSRKLPPEGGTRKFRRHKIGRHAVSFKRAGGTSADHGKMKAHKQADIDSPLSQCLKEQIDAIDAGKCNPAPGRKFIRDPLRPRDNPEADAAIRIEFLYLKPRGKTRREALRACHKDARTSRIVPPRNCGREVHACRRPDDKDRGRCRVLRHFPERRECRVNAGLICRKTV